MNHKEIDNLILYIGSLLTMDDVHIIINSYNDIKKNGYIRGSNYILDSIYNCIENPDINMLTITSILLDTLIKTRCGDDILHISKQCKTLTKKHHLWHKIDIRTMCFNRISRYNTYKKKWPDINRDFDKYCKMYGLIRSKDKWKKKFHNLQPSNLYNNPKVPVCLPLSLLERIYDTFSKKEKSNATQRVNSYFWPLMVSLISSPILRERPDYILLSVEDVFRMEIISTMIYDNDDREKFTNNFIDDICNHRYEDVKRLKKKYLSCADTAIYLKNAYRKKRSY